MRKVLFLLAVFFILARPVFATVTDTESPIKIYTSATVTAYPIPFDYIDDADIEVTLVTIATGAETAQTLNVDYTIASDTVTYATAPGAAYKLVIRRVTPFTQESTWIAGSAPPLSAYESAFDKLTYLAQDLKEKTDRALLLPAGTAISDTTVPDPTYNAGKYLKVNAAGTKYEAADLVSGSMTMNVAKLSDYASFAAMVTAIGSTEITVYIDTAGTLSANTVIPSTLHLVFHRGGAITLGNYNLTFNCQPDAPAVKIFNITGTGAVTGLTLSRPEWWYSSGTYATALQAAIDASVEVALVANKTYTIDAALVCSSIFKRFSGGGEIYQSDKTKNLFTASGYDDLNLSGMLFRSDSDITAAAYNSAIYLVNCDRAKITNNDFSYFGLHAVYLKDCEDVIVSDNTMDHIWYGIFFSGVRRGSIQNNILRNTITPTSTFTVAITLDSTDGHSYGICKDICIIGNHVYSYRQSQAILVHSGQRVAISGNIIYDCLAGISCNPYNITDLMDNIAITGNSCVGPQGTFVADTGVTGGTGINVAGSLTFAPTNVTIGGNTVDGFNSYVSDAALGGISIGYSYNVVVVGNTVRNSYANGIVINNDALRVTIRSNNVVNVIAYSGTSNSILVNTVTDHGTTAEITDNMLDTATSGVRIEKSNLFPEVVVDRNRYEDITTRNCVGSGGAGLFDGVGTYTAGDATPSVLNVRSMTIINSGAVTITNFDDGYEGQIITLYFHDSNTTVARTHAYLAGGSSFSSSQYDTLVLMKRGSYWIEISRAANS